MVVEGKAVPLPGSEARLDRISVVRLVKASDGYGILQAERQLVAALKRSGAEVVVLALGPEGARNAYADFDCPVVQAVYPVKGYKGHAGVKALALLHNWLTAVRSAGGLQGYLAPFMSRPNPVVSIRRVDLLPVATVLARKLSGTVVWHMSEDVKPGPLAMNRLATRLQVLSDRTRVVGNSCYSIRSLLGRTEPVVYPGFAPSRLITTASRAEVRRTAGLPDDAVVFLVCGRLVHEKAPDLLIEAFARVAESDPELHLVFVGDTPKQSFREQLVELRDRLCAGRVHFCGAQAQVADWYNMADVVINGRRDAEPFGITIVEALAAARPVLAYREGGPAETIVDGETGWLVSEATVNGYEQGMRRVLNDRARWTAMGARAAEEVMAFSAERQGQRYCELVAELALGNSRR